MMNELLARYEELVKESHQFKQLQDDFSSEIAAHVERIEKLEIQLQREMTLRVQITREKDMIRGELVAAISSSQCKVTEIYPISNED